MSKQKHDENIPKDACVQCPSRFTGSEEQAKNQAKLWGEEAARLESAARVSMEAGNFEAAMEASTKRGEALTEQARWEDKAKPDTRTATGAARSSTKYAVEGLTEAGADADTWETLFGAIGRCVANGGNGEQARGVVLSHFEGTKVHATLKDSMASNMKKSKESRSK